MAQEEGGFHAVELGGQAHRPEQAAGDQRRIAEGGTQARDAAQEFGQAPVGSRVGQAQLPRVGPGRQHVVGDLRILRLVEAQAGADGLAFQAEIHEGEDGIVAVVGLDPQLAIGHQRAVLHVVAQGCAAPARGMAEQLRGDGRPVARGEAHGSQHAFEPVHGVAPVKRASM